MLHDSGILGPHDVREAWERASGAGTAAVPLCQAAQGRHLHFEMLTPKTRALPQQGPRRLLRSKVSGSSNILLLSGRQRGADATQDCPWLLKLGR